MKIYNVEDTKKFFETLSECKGEVDLVKKDGSRLMLNKTAETDHLTVLANTYENAHIDEMELDFADSDDAMKMCEFLTGMDTVA